MNNIRLPKPFGKIINREYKEKGYVIINAYVDEMEHNLINGLKGIRELLDVQGDESVCDLFCELKLGDGTILKIIFEDKNSKHQKSIFDARKQLEKTSILIRDKLGINLDYAVACTMSLEQPFKARKTFNSPFKEIHISWNNCSNQAKLLETKVPLLWSR